MRVLRNPDLVIATVLFAIAVAVASWYVPYFVRSGGKPWFYQDEFGPAVMSACGLGYVNPDTANNPQLRAFLARERDQITCDVLQPARPAPLRSMQTAFRYLMFTVGTTWWLEGNVSWSALLPLYALLYGITVVLAYFIFRQGMRPAFAGAAGLAIALSTLHLNNLPHLRDYGKAPFVLAIVLIAMRVIGRPMPARRTLFLAMIAGVISGIGIGFRNDLLVGVPAMLVTFVIFLPTPLPSGLRIRAAAGATYLIVTILAMMPMWSIYRTGGGNSSQHLVLLGLADEFTAELGLDNSRLYRWIFDYRDELAEVMISDYASRRLGADHMLPMYGVEYDQAASKLLADIATTFPADMLVRVYASSVNILRAPYSTTTTALMPPAFVTEPLLKFSRARTWVLRRLTPLWPWFYGVTLVALSVHSLRLGLFAALFVLYLSGYPALQFQERHIFHLEFIGWWAAGFACNWLWTIVRAVRYRDRRAEVMAGWRPAWGWRRAIAAASVLWIVTGLALLLPLWKLRGVQQVTVGQFLQSVVDAPREPVASNVADQADGRVALNMPALTGPVGSTALHTEYLLAEFGGSECETLKLDVTYRYQAFDKSHDFTSTVAVQPPLTSEPVQLFAPVYSLLADGEQLKTGGFAFRGLELPKSALNCLGGVYRVRDPRSLPLLPDLQLRPQWRTATLYATIDGLEGRVPPLEFPEVHTFPTQLAVKRTLLMQPLTPFDPGEITKVSPTFAMASDGWHVKGVGGVGGRGPFLYLVEFGERPLKKDAYVIAQGTIEVGGLSFGLVKGDEWIAQVPVLHTGAFAVVIKVPEDANYKVVLANNLTGTSLENRLHVERAGVLSVEPAP